MYREATVELLRPDVGVVGVHFFGCTAVMRAGRPDVVIATSPPLSRRARVDRGAAAVAAGALDLRSPRSLARERNHHRSPLANGCSRVCYRGSNDGRAKRRSINRAHPGVRDNIVRRGLRLGRRSSSCRMVPISKASSLAQTSRSGANSAGAIVSSRCTPEHREGQCDRPARRGGGQLSGRSDILLVTVGDGPERRRWEERGQRADEYRVPRGPCKARMPRFVSAPTSALRFSRTIRPFKPCIRTRCSTIWRRLGRSPRDRGHRPDAGLRRGASRSVRAARAAEGTRRRVRRLADEPETARTLGLNGRAWVWPTRVAASLLAYTALLLELPALLLNFWKEARASARAHISWLVLKTSFSSRGKRAADLSVAIGAIALAPVLCMPPGDGPFSDGIPYFLPPGVLGAQDGASRWSSSAR